MSGYDAGILTQQFRPDLIVLDLGLPGLDGLTVLGRLHEAGSPSRVLILTARGEVEHRVQAVFDLALRAVIDFVGEQNMHEGDVFLLNYPYWSSAPTLEHLEHSTRMTRPWMSLWPP